MTCRGLAPQLCGLLLLSWLAGPGCAARRDATVLPRDTLIREIHFEGVSRFSPGTLLTHLQVGETRRMPLTPDYFYDEAILWAQARRIEELYRAYGYVRARVTEIRPEFDEQRKRAVITLRVEEGPRTTVTAVRFRWAADGAVAAELQARVQAVASLTQGGPFEVARLNDTAGSLRLELLRLGYPLAQVSASSLVDEASSTAEAEFAIEPGPFARIGAVRFEGLVDVPRSLAEREADFVLGEPYSPARAEQVAQAVKALRVFRWVSVVPPRQVDQGSTTLTVRVSEAEPQSVALGVRASFETVRWQQQATARYTHTNLFGNLTRLDLELLGGWAELPAPWRANAHGPVIDLAPSFSKKGWVERRLTWTLQPRLETDIQEGYQYYSPSNRVGVSRWFLGTLAVGLSHTLRYVDFFNLGDALDTRSSILGDDFRDPFFLSYLELRADLFRVDSVAHPSRGVVVESRYQLAGGALGGAFDFHKFQLGGRAYWKPVPRVQLAGRAQAGVILPYGAQPGVPFNFKYYLGGANTVRGWGSRRLSPRLERCAVEDPGDCSSVPVGGRTMVQAGVEARTQLVGDLSGVVFVDLGDVQDGELSFVPAEWNYSVGPGLRYDSPLGLFRLDLGWRVNDPGIYPDEPRWAVYFGLGETF